MARWPVRATNVSRLALSEESVYTRSMEPGFWTTATAVGGFVIALLTAAWTVYRDLLDRHKVDVSAATMLIWSLAPAQIFRNAWHQDEECIIFTATNAGRRPVTITGFHFKVANSPKHAMVCYDPQDPRSRCFDGMPKELHEGQSARAFLTAKEIEGDEIEYAYALDTIGRQWKSKTFPLRPTK